MEWQLKPSSWDLDVPQQAESDNMRSSNSLQIHNGQWGLQKDDYRGAVKVCIEGLVGKIHDQSHHHDGNHIIGAWQKGFHFPMPSTSGTNTTNMFGDSGSSSGCFPAAPTMDCSNGNQQAAPFPSKDPVELHNYGWLYSGSTVEIPRVASGLNAGKVDNTNHRYNYANDDDYRNHQQQGYNSTINGNGAQLIGANGAGGVVGGNKEIIIAPKRRYPKQDGKINRSEGTMAMPTGSCAYKKRNMGSGGRMQVPHCQVDGCKEDLAKAKKDYHRRHKVCEMHSKAPQVITSGIEQRFCQQCSRFHAISEFDYSKKSCRRRLAGHNERRRKLSQDTTAFSLASMFQDERQHLNYFIQYPLSMPLPRIYKNQDTRRSRSRLEEACRAQLALMNGGILPRNSTNRLFSIMHACKDSSSPHDTLKYTNTNNHDNNNNPSIGEGLTLCSSNSINIDRGSQPSASAN